MQEILRAKSPSAKFLKLVMMMKDLGVRKFKGEQNTVLADKWWCISLYLGAYNTLRRLMCHLDTKSIPNL